MITNICEQSFSFQTSLDFRIEDKGFGARICTEFEQVDLIQKKREFLTLVLKEWSAYLFKCIRSWKFFVNLWMRSLNIILFCTKRPFFPPQHLLHHRQHFAHCLTMETLLSPARSWKWTMTLMVTSYNICGNVHQQYSVTVAQVHLKHMS